MLINEDSTFEYEISSIALKSLAGEWELERKYTKFSLRYYLQTQVVFTLLN